MDRRAAFAIIAFCGSCDVFWGYTKIPALEGNCQIGGVICQSYEQCSPESETCERRLPQIDAASPRVIFSDGGDVVTLTGKYFATDIEVLIDNQPVSMLEITSGQEIKFRTKPKSAPVTYGSVPAVLTIRSGSKTLSKPDLLSWSADTATFNAYSISGVVTETPATAPASIQIADMDGDGKNDIVSRSAATGKFHIAKGTVNGMFSTGVSIGANPAIASGHFITADINNDSRVDLIYWANSSTSLRYILNNGGSSFAAEMVFRAIGGGNYFLGFSDLNKDGKSDLVAIDYSSTKFDVYLSNQVGGIIPAPTARTFNYPNSFSKVPLFGDIDKDGNNDLIIGPDANKVYVNYGKGDGSFDAPALVDNGPNAIVAAVVDVDDDGLLDIVFVPNPSIEAYVFRNMNNRTFSRTAISLGALSVYATCFIVSDVNGDGKKDIFLFERYKQDPSGFAFMGYGNGTFRSGRQVVSTTFPPIDDDRYGDLNNDGRMDMALIKYNNNSVYAVVGK